MNFYGVFSVLLMFLPLRDGFLLQSSNQQTALKQNQNSTYMTVDEFLEAQKHLQASMENQHQEMEYLRQTIDKTNALLVAQLNQKLLEFENKISEATQQNHSFMQTQLLEHQYLEQNYSSLLQGFITLQENYEKQEKEIIFLRNRTEDLETELESLKNVNSLRDLETLKQRIQSIDFQTSSLTSNQVARNQDFLALYNETLSTKQEVQYLKNATYHLLERNISEIIRKVALTACSSEDQSGVAGGIVRFQKIVYQIGINDMSSFTNSNKFKCEYAGLYLISVTITSYTSINHYYIYVNGNMVAVRYLDHDSQVKYQSTSATVTYKLNKNDLVYVYRSNMIVNSAFSCFSVLKIH